ncbi:hypothetical protein HDV00_009844 [Rhizophlyctis rosea]|nr:hypothetical protein HDV00_009844 [Rhizophlyctis rosea]
MDEDLLLLPTVLLGDPDSATVLSISNAASTTISQLRPIAASHLIGDIPLPEINRLKLYDVSALNVSCNDDRLRNDTAPITDLFPDVVSLDPFRLVGDVFKAGSPESASAARLLVVQTKTAGEPPPYAGHERRISTLNNQPPTLLLPENPDRSLNSPSTHSSNEPAGSPSVHRDALNEKLGVFGRRTPPSNPLPSTPPSTPPTSPPQNPVALNIPRQERSNSISPTRSGTFGTGGGRGARSQSLSTLTPPTRSPTTEGRPLSSSFTSSTAPASPLSPTSTLSVSLHGRESQRPSSNLSNVSPEHHNDRSSSRASTSSSLSQHSVDTLAFGTRLSHVSEEDSASSSRTDSPDQELTKWKRAVQTAIAEIESLKTGIHSISVKKERLEQINQDLTRELFDLNYKYKEEMRAVKDALQSRENENDALRRTLHALDAHSASKYDEISAMHQGEIQHLSQQLYTTTDALVATRKDLEHATAERDFLLTQQTREAEKGKKVDAFEDTIRQAIKSAKKEKKKDPAMRLEVSLREKVSGECKY